MDRPNETGPQGACALVLSNAVGDGVMMMALAHNLVRSGRSPRIHGRVAEQLAAWYPWADIARPGTTPAGRPDRYDLVVALYGADLVQPLNPDGRAVAVASLPDFREAGDHMLDRIVAAGRHLGVGSPGRASGMVVPAQVTAQRDRQRVVIHPTASHPEKTWQRAKFVQLAQALQRRGFRPSFIVPPAERASWREVETANGIPVCAFPTLDGVASWIAGAGWFIGNDSGPGHLASALGIPTVSLFMRKGLARTWRPGWAPGRVVLPLGLLPGARLRERYWQRLVSVARVLRAFDTLRAEVDRGAAGAASA